MYDSKRRQAPRPNLRMKYGDCHPEADRGRRRLASFSSGASALDAIGGEAPCRLACNPEPCA